MHLFANMTLTLTTWPTWPFDHLTYNLLLTSKNANRIFLMISFNQWLQVLLRVSQFPSWHFEKLFDWQRNCHGFLIASAITIAIAPSVRFWRILIFRQHLYQPWGGLELLWSKTVMDGSKEKPATGVPRCPTFFTVRCLPPSRDPWFKSLDCVKWLNSVPMK